MYIITIVVRNEMVRVQMDNERSAKNFSWWCLMKGYIVKCYQGRVQQLTRREVVVGTRLVNDYSNGK